MSSRTSKENKALRWYCETNGLVPQLSTHPTYYFRTRAGEEKKAKIEHIVQDYDRQRKEDVKEAKRTAAIIKREGLK